MPSNDFFLPQAASFCRCPLHKNEPIEHFLLLNMDTTRVNYLKSRLSCQESHEKCFCMYLLFSMQSRCPYLIKIIGLSKIIIQQFPDFSESYHFVVAFTMITITSCFDNLQFYLSSSSQPHKPSQKYHFMILSYMYCIPSYNQALLSG